MSMAFIKIKFIGDIFVCSKINRKESFRNLREFSPLLINYLFIFSIFFLISAQEKGEEDSN
jgi:hypothetical protein